MISTLTILSLDQGNIYVPPWVRSVEPTTEPLNAGVAEPRSRRWNLWNIARNFLGLPKRFLATARLERSL